ncbi:MAG: class I SAM-dependent DNA methyltransferase [Lachnospiraceae bacterium]|nr:class I SAM-dependent DNA methyltransferase [Lachnospiraceae bacterium]
MTDAQQREAARQFFYKWNGKGKEDEDARSYWIDIIQNILGVENVTDRVEFEKKVVGGDGNTKRIDVYVPETHVLIEQKSLGIALDKPQAGHNGMTPYEQAKMYDNYLPFDERARWIVTSNFAEIWIYDRNAVKPEPIKITLMELPEKYHMIDFLVNKEVTKVTDEMKISLQAGELVGQLYDAFLKQYKDPENEETLKSLNKLCVRIVFCLYAEDASVFGKKSMFHDYMQQFNAAHARKGLRDLFRVLNQKPEDRDPYLADDDPMLAAFPYVNGGLFDGDDIEIPPFTDEIMDLLLRKASDDFDWSEISPTIFGAVFESTLNPETRRSGGMHYTSIENIHKVIDPLFLDDLKAEFEEIKGISVLRTQEKRLHALQDKLASLSFLDPSAGSGNFLTESYLQLRKLENEILRILTHGQIQFGYADMTPIKVSISQFYGIEINDFAVTVARTALWIAENQMLKETEDIVHMQLDFLPLKTNAYIVEGNALRIDWNDVVDKSKLSYIMGNPPFVGARLMSSEQKSDVIHVFGEKYKNVGNLDYVCCWYRQTSEMMKGTGIRAALVSTNSVCQGETVANLWKPLFNDGIHIDFAHRTFIWDSEAKVKAHVHCVIVGFSYKENKKERIIWDGETTSVVTHINAYLIDADDIFVESRNKPINSVPDIGIGNKPIDGGFYLFEKEEMEDFVKKEPAAKEYFHPWYGSREFINRCPRYCLWLGDCMPGQLRNLPECVKRIEAVRKYRLESPSAGTRKLADTPTRFHVENMPKGTYVVIPEVSSERRRYVPMGFLTPDIMCSNLVKIVPDASLFHFGILTSNVHMSWMRAVCGRLKSDYRYSKDIVYNNFPWPTLTDEQEKTIEKTAQGILDAREKYPDSSLADLYDPTFMPPELRKAHQANDRAVMHAYGMPIKETDEASCVAWLMRLYQEKIAELEGN